ncbi:hypothetical protein E2320_010705 [Naja naja]|nr:hypothetical protein E2320_010705 [Naja naja]
MAILVEKSNKQLIIPYWIWAPQVFIGSYITTISTMKALGNSLGAVRMNWDLEKLVLSFPSWGI